MDNIYQRVRNRTSDGLIKLEKEMRGNARELYYQKKTDLYSMMKDKKKNDEENVEKLIKKTQVPINFLKKQEEELKKLC